MPVRVLPDFLINQIAAGEVVERPASVVKELVENALDAGADQIIIDVVDGGRTKIDVIDNGGGMSRDDLGQCISRHATSKLPDDDLLNINFMGFRGEALPSIASVSDMTIDTNNGMDSNGWQLDCSTGEIRPSSWDGGTRVRVQNLFSRTPARLKFMRGDRAEMMSIVDVVKRLAMARPDVGFTLNNKWRFPRGQELSERIVAVMGEDVRGQMLAVDAVSNSTANMKLSGFISRPTLRRASSVDQYLFVNSRPVKDKVLVGALRAAYMDVMHAREFPLCALYLELDPRCVDVNVSPAKTDVHFLEPSHVRAFIIRSLRDTLAQTMVAVPASAQSGHDEPSAPVHNAPAFMPYVSAPRQPGSAKSYGFHSPELNDFLSVFSGTNSGKENAATPVAESGAVCDGGHPLGRAVAQIHNKYIICECGDNVIIVDQHAAHERITYEHLRRNTLKTQPFITPIIIQMRGEDVVAILEIADELRASGLHLDAFGDDAVAVFEAPADWKFNWDELLHSIADEVRAHGHSSQLNERLHLKLANYACHHSVRAGQKLDMAQMDALLRDIENTERAGQCNHGRPVYKIIPLMDIDSMFERI